MNPKLQIFLIGLYSQAIIIWFSGVRCSDQLLKDPMQKIVGGEKGPFAQMRDGWSFSHFIWFAIVANMFPNEIPFLVFGGVMWEIFEYLTSNYDFKMLKILRGISECKIVTDESQTWFYAKYTDIIMNILGCFTGYLVYKRLKFQIKNPSVILFYYPLLFCIIYSLYNKRFIFPFWDYFTKPKGEYKENKLVAPAILASIAAVGTFAFSAAIALTYIWTSLGLSPPTR